MANWWTPSWWDIRACAARSPTSRAAAAEGGQDRPGVVEVSEVCDHADRDQRTRRESQQGQSPSLSLGQRGHAEPVECERIPLRSVREDGETVPALADQRGGLPQVPRLTVDDIAQSLGVGALPVRQVPSEVAAQQVKGGLGG